MTGAHRDGIPAAELIDRAALQRAAAAVIRERYGDPRDYPREACPGPISDRLKLAAALGRVDMHPQRGVEKADPAYLRLHDGYPMKGRK